MLFEILVCRHLPWLHSCPIVSLASESGTVVRRRACLGFPGLETIRDSHVTLGVEDSFEIDTDREKQSSYTFAIGDSQTSNSRVTFSTPVTSKVSVGMHFGCMGQEAPTLLGLDVVRTLDVIPGAVRGKVYSRRLSGVFAHHDIAERTPRLGPAQVTKHAAFLTGGDHC